MQIIKGQGVSFQCCKCQRENIPLWQNSAETCLDTYCQRCVFEAFQNYADQQWKEKQKKGVKHE